MQASVSSKRPFVPGPVERFSTAMLSERWSDARSHQEAHQGELEVANKDKQNKNNSQHRGKHM